ncbi:hypothetical protein QYE76_016302 [Lolium multiflorum]|uniref:DUF4283 domain-containing protein n=1 Tax=Lolium multiflorum TaxID=4521 RepID=A0AAD8X8J4_LOLMU|nr:hypothetical protein QYE76_016302 [Lolium multiflorum]
MRESTRATRRGKEEILRGVQLQYAGVEAVGRPINPNMMEDVEHSIREIQKCFAISNPGQSAEHKPPRPMESREGKKEVLDNDPRQGNLAGGRAPGNRRALESGASQAEQTWAATRSVGLLMAPPDGGGEQGGLAERPTHPKPSGGRSAAPLPRRRALLGLEMLPDDDGNWDDGQRMEEEPGFRQGSEVRIGGTVDMEDDVYLEFDEEEDLKEAPEDPSTWKLLARYMANFKPNTRAMFNYFADEAWRLRTGIRYSEKGKNYYRITLFSKGDYDFVMRGGPWIFNQNALLVKKLDEAAQPSETVLDSVPIWMRIYDVPWGKHNKIWGMRYGDGLGEAMEVDVPSEEQDENEFLRVRVNLPYAKYPLVSKENQGR